MDYSDAGRDGEKIWRGAVTIGGDNLPTLVGIGHPGADITG